MMKDIQQIDQERKPWEDKPTGPAPIESPKMFSIDLLKIFRWFRKKEKKDV